MAQICIIYISAWKSDNFSHLIEIRPRTDWVYDALPAWTKIVPSHFPLKGELFSLFYERDIILVYYIHALAINFEYMIKDISSNNNIMKHISCCVRFIYTYINQLMLCKLCTAHIIWFWFTNKSVFQCKLHHCLLSPS